MDDKEAAKVLAAIICQAPEQLQIYALRSFILGRSWKNRGVLLGLLQQILSVLARLDGSAGLLEVERGVRDTAKWFP
jgi:hypothetical protein